MDELRWIQSPELNLKLELYKMAVQTRNLEIGLFWQRSNYFLVLNTAIAVGFFNLTNTSYELLLSLTGIFVAGSWVRVNLGSKFWQMRWEFRSQQTEKNLGDQIDLFSANWERRSIRMGCGISASGSSIRGKPCFAESRHSLRGTI